MVWKAGCVFPARGNALSTQKSLRNWSKIKPNISEKLVRLKKMLDSGPIAKQEATENVFEAWQSRYI